MIVNEGRPIEDGETLRWVIQSILGIQGWCEEAEAAVERIANLGQPAISHEEVARVMRSVVSDQIRSDPTRFERWADLLQKLTEHDLTTSRNRTAFMPSAKENPDAVFWPDPTNPKRSRSIFGEKAFAKRHRFISRSTPIGSAGSCFAIRIAEMFQRQSYSYVVTESNLNASGQQHLSCARWGIIFNTPSLRQLVERAFGLRQLPKLLWSTERDGKQLYFDPFREDIHFQTVEEYEQDIESHIAAARRALLESKVFVMTLGMNEVWFLKSGKHALARAPWGVAPSLVEARTLTVEENVAELQRMLDVWRAFNPDLKLIVTTSPVPLHATFRGADHHVITANCHSKATMRLAAESFASKNEDVHYFPAYETVLYCTKNPWAEDQRHVSEEAVQNVMALFSEMFLVEGGLSYSA